MTLPRPSARVISTVLNDPWSEYIPDLQIAWDSTTYRTFLECPRKYQYAHISGWRSTRDAPALSFGILMHKAVETYHVLKAAGATEKIALRQVVKFCMRDGLVLNQIAGRMDKPDNARTRSALVRAALWYLFTHQDDVAKTYILANGKPATELSFRVSLDLMSPDGIPYIWCGHIDRVIEMDGALMPSDLKTTAYALSDRWFEQFSPNIQMSGYLFACKIILPSVPINKILIDGVELKVNFNRYMRAFTSRTPAQMEEWLFNIHTHIRHAEVYATERYWPMNEQSCDKYGGCVFRRVCSRDPASRKTWLEADFKIDKWNPLESRET